VTPFAALFERKSWLGPLGSRVADLIREAGPAVPSNALRIAAAYSCVRVISETVASLPVFVYRRTAQGKERATDHPLYPLLHLAPTPTQTSFGWKETKQVHLCLRGNGYAWIRRNRSDRSIRSLDTLYPDLVEVKVLKTGEVRYLVQHEPGAARQEHPAADILHLKGLSTDGVMGRSPVQDARYAFEVADATAQTAANLYARGFRNGLVVSHPKTLSGPAQQNLRESFAKHYGPNGLEYPIVLEEDTKVTPITMTPDDAEFLDTRKFSRSEIAGLFRVPLHLIGDLERSTNNNIEHQSLEFAIHCIRPWLVRWEQALTVALLNEDERGQFFIEFEMDALLRGDSESRAKHHTAMFLLGARTTNEIRALENMNAIEGGDVRYVPGNLMKLGSTGVAAGTEPAGGGVAA
jgi:HK97 family phage portal protein